MDKILYKKELLGIRIKKLSMGSNPISAEGDPLQLLTLKQPKGARVKPHTHTPKRRATMHLQECIVVLKGKVRVDLYGDGTKVLKRVTLKKGETFITISGGHSVTFLENSELIETKNGPFIKDRIDLV